MRARTHTHTLTHTSTTLQPKQNCEREIVLLWNKCSRIQGMCSQRVPVHKQDGARLSSDRNIYTHVHTHIH